jgi:hypothetical protein
MASFANDYGEGRRTDTEGPATSPSLLDDEGHPRFIWRSIGVTIKPLSHVDEAFAWDEG